MRNKSGAFFLAMDRTIPNILVEDSSKPEIFSKKAIITFSLIAQFNLIPCHF
jgi:hypothetical protein